jgi:Rps23 Pro-64 3,4-dihydroxylase Tpa1-like proline 4-hydroxylase
METYSNFNRPMNFSDYVRVYDDALTIEVCADLILRFEHEKHNQVQRQDGLRSFTEVNVNASGWVLDPIIRPMLKYRQQYFQDCAILPHMIPAEQGFEQVRMQRYLKDSNEEFKPHVDVYEPLSSKRFLAYFWYLNDVAEGGDTVFYRLDKEVKIQPRAGRLVMFPVNWQYLYATLATVSDDSYTIGGYLHYE